MFVGHLAAALIGKRTAPSVSLGWLVAAAFGLDLLWPVLLLAGIETVRIDPGNTAFTSLDFVSYPWSHSLLTTAGWSGITWLVARRVAGDARGAAVLAALVASHWLLDLVTHRPDLPLWPGGPVVGLGLWHSIPATIAVEGVLSAAAVMLYLRSSTARDGIGRWAFLSLLALVTVIWISGPWAPPPPNVRSIAIVGLAMWLFPPWSGWIDRHRAWAGTDPRMTSGSP